ncbi:MAG: PIN domain-containing protein [Candidatus Binatia bacterium]
MGGTDPPFREYHLSLYLLDTTVLVAHLRGESDVTGLLLRLLSEGHHLGTTCVNIAEVERGVRPRERRTTALLLERLKFIETTREAAIRAGRYQREWQVRGHTIHMPDALIAGTARAHGAIILTDNVKHFPMRDVRVIAPPRSANASLSSS